MLTDTFAPPAATSSPLRPLGKMLHGSVVRSSRKL
jgi:hypothetical protein